MRKIVIGRDPNCDFVLADDSVSRRHAELVDQGGQLTLCDYGGVNGTSVLRNGEPEKIMGQIPVTGEDVLLVGDVEVPVQFILDAVAAPAQVTPRNVPPRVYATEPSTMELQPATRKAVGSDHWIPLVQRGLLLLRLAVAVPLILGLFAIALVLSIQAQNVSWVPALLAVLSLVLTVLGQFLCLQSPVARPYITVALGGNALMTAMTFLSLAAPAALADLFGLLAGPVAIVTVLAYFRFLHLLALSIERADLARQVVTLVALAPSLILLARLTALLHIEALTIIVGLSAFVVTLYSLVAYSGLLVRMSRALGGESEPAPAAGLVGLAAQTAPSDIRKQGAVQMLVGLLMLALGVGLSAASGNTLFIGLLAVGGVYTLVGLVQAGTGVKIR